MHLEIHIPKNKHPDSVSLADESDWYVEDHVLYVNAEDGNTYVYNLDYVKGFDVVR